MIDRAFPRLASSSSFSITSPKSPAYNCIAWAAQETHRYWWPDPLQVGHWPDQIPREITLEAFSAAFAMLGYQECDSPEPETGYQKIALYADSGVPKHAARQLANGRWTSKLGKAEDVQHNLEDLEGTVYGQVVRVFRRKR